MNYIVHMQFHFKESYCLLKGILTSKTEIWYTKKYSRFLKILGHYPKIKIHSPCDPDSANVFSAHRISHSVRLDRAGVHYPPDVCLQSSVGRVHKFENAYIKIHEFLRINDDLSFSYLRNNIFSIQNLRWCRWWYRFKSSGIRRRVHWSFLCFQCYKLQICWSSWDLKIEAIGLSETSIDADETTWLPVAEDLNFLHRFSSWKLFKHYLIN